MRNNSLLPGIDLRMVRKRHRYSQSQFAAIMGVHVQTLSKWERGAINTPFSAKVLAYLIDTHPVIRDEVERMAGL